MMDIEIYETGKKFEIKDSWGELTQAEFIYLSGLLYRMSELSLTLPDCQQLLFYKLSGFKVEKKFYDKDEKETIFSNIAHLASNLGFFWKVQADGEGVNRLEFDFSFDRFFIDKLKIKKKETKCLFFKLQSGIAETDMTAEAFVDGYNLYTLFENTRNMVFLEKLAMIFIKDKNINIKVLSIDVLFAMYIQFAGLMNYLVDRSGYSILFNRESTDDGKLRIGLADTLYSLSKNGYGNLKDVCGLNLFEYLDLLLKETIDTVKQLNELEKPMSEICEITGLSQEQINSIV